MSRWEPPPPVAPTAPPALDRPLAEQFPDLPRHFVFEYYPWYGAAPVRHWDQWDRVPPDDLAANYVPALGAYDSVSTSVIEQHAAWITEVGAGAINLSWWGPGSYEDRAVHRVMDVMQAHGIRVAFHLEPYAAGHGYHYADDILYLLREYGAKRHFDALLVLRDRDGAEGPVFKGFRTILPRDFTDCHGLVHSTPDYTPDDVWRAQIDRLRHTLRAEFDHVTLLADSLDFIRTPAAGFDGIAIYDNFVPPTSYTSLAATATAHGLLFSFNANPGYDTIEPRLIEIGECYEPLPFAPPTERLDWTRAADRERAAERSRDRIRQSLEATLQAQQDPRLKNAQRGFFLVYLTSFNEWHEGHAFEPMLDAAELKPAQQALGYHNPAHGDHRLRTLQALLSPGVGEDVRGGRGAGPVSARETPLAPR